MPPGIGMTELSTKPDDDQAGTSQTKKPRSGTAQQQNGPDSTHSSAFFPCYLEAGKGACC